MWCLNRLHEVEPLEGLEMLPPAALSRLVAAKALRTVPYPLLGENTLVISDSLVLAPDDHGRLALLFRQGVYPAPTLVACLMGQARLRLPRAPQAHLWSNRLCPGWPLSGTVLLLLPGIGLQSGVRQHVQAALLASRH